MKKVDLDGNWFDGETLYSSLERAIETPKKKTRLSMTKPLVAAPSVVPQKAEPQDTGSNTEVDEWREFPNEASGVAFAATIADCQNTKGATTSVGATDKMDIRENELR